MNRDKIIDYSKIFWELVIYKGLVTLISMVAYIFFIMFNNSYNVIYMILIINILASIFDISWLYQGLEEYKLISIRNIFIKILCTIFIFALVKHESDLYLYVLLNSFSLLISSLSLWFKLPKYIVKVSFKKLRIFSHFKDTWIYFMPQIATQMYTMLDKTMLGILTGSEIENGYYEQAYKIVTILLTIITSLNIVLSPRMSYLYKNKNYEEIKIRLLKSIKFVFLLGIPMTLGLIAVTPGFVNWFFGEEYAKVNILLPIFAPIILIIALSNCIGSQCLTPCGMRGKSAIALWLGAGFNFITNLLLIPKFGSIGATIASVGAESVITASYFFLAKSFLSIKKCFINSWKYLISGIIMFIIVLYLVQNLPIGMMYTIIEVIIGMLVYSMILIVLQDSLVVDILKGAISYSEKILFKRRKNM